MSSFIVISLSGNPPPKKKYKLIYQEYDLFLIESSIFWSRHCSMKTVPSNQWLMSIIPTDQSLINFVPINTSNH